MPNAVEHQTPFELPVVDAEPRERADAARNRRRILAAAERLFADRGVDSVSMDTIAAEAGVGKGTLFRRFGDRASLALAVLDETERAFQDALLTGPAPLGPGAPPCERLVAFGEACLDRLEAQGDLMLHAELASGTGYLRSEPHAAKWIHVRALVAQARPDCDVDYVTDILVGVLSAQVVAHQRSRDVPLERLKAGYADLVDRMLGG
jgi:AcrR family transcriptional regulator